MKKSFTLIELIFVIVIIGLLASFAVPKFMQTYYSAKSSNVKSVISSLRTAIETKHGENIIDDSATENYPFPLDNAELKKSNQKLFSRVLKNPINSCLSDNCWYKDDNTSDSETYAFKYNDNTTLKVTYYEVNGSIECVDGDNLSAADCDTIINR
jgi:general secretion pathway protein G